MARVDLIAKRAKLEADWESDDTQAVYDDCREARLHTWDRTDPTGGGRLIVHRKERKKTTQVRRDLMCMICTTKRRAIYWSYDFGNVVRYEREGNFIYDHPKGYEAKDSGYGPMTQLEHRTRVFDRLPVVEGGD